MPQQRSRIYKGRWQQMRMPIPLHGMLSVPFRMFGVRPSRMNPNTCTICELMFTRVMRVRKISIDAKRDALVREFGLTGAELGVGIGIDAGELNFGVFGRAHRDLTVVGNVVNTAARTQSAAAAGEILVTRAVYNKARSNLPGGPAQSYQLRGLAAPIEPYAA